MEQEKNHIKFKWLVIMKKFILFLKKNIDFLFYLNIIKGFCWRSSMVEQLICNQQVAGSNPIASFTRYYGERFPSGQRGQTVNLLAMPSEVRILPSPPSQEGIPLNNQSFLFGRE